MSFIMYQSGLRIVIKVNSVIVDNRTAYKVNCKRRGRINNNFTQIAITILITYYEKIFTS